MKRETISQGVSNIDHRYIQEATEFFEEGKEACRLSGSSGHGISGQRPFRHSSSGRRASKYAAFVKKTAAAAIVLCLLACGVAALWPAHEGAVTVYARETDEEITAAGAVLSTGTISDSGKMKGHPLTFYLSGRDIATVRFSCKNQLVNFMDWTEKREEYGNARNFTVAYGEDESEYYYLTYYWEPQTIIRELTDNADSTIATLPEEMRSDIIVLEITFGNGKTATKAIKVSLLDNGTFFAMFDEYRISEEDSFVRRPDSEAIPREILYAQGAAASDGSEDTKIETQEKTSLTEEQIEKARQAALAYYADTVFTVNSIEYAGDKMPYEEGEGDCCFKVNVSKGGVVQEPDRGIVLRLEDGRWKVVNEGY